MADYDDIKKFLDRVDYQVGGSNQNKVSSLGGSLGYTQPIDDTSSIRAGISGHYAKSKDFEDKGIDRATLSYKKKLQNDHEFGAKIGANLNKDQGKTGVDEIGVSYKIPFKKGGKVSSASKRGDGIAQRGKTKGRLV
jgi:hypothetical protein